MPNTVPDNIVYPSSSSDLTPLETVFAALASSVQTALTTAYSYGGARSFANASDRNTAFPSPVQGNTVYRTDKGWTEQYYTTPAVATAGWYPVSGDLPTARAVKTSSQNTQSTANAFIVVVWDTDQYSSGLMSGSRITVTQPGMYSIIGQARVTALDIYGGIFVSGTLKQDTVQGATNIGTFKTSTILRLAANDYIELGVAKISSGTSPLIVDTCALEVRYLGP